MGYILFVFLCVAAIVGIYVEKNIHNPITLFCGYWAVLILLALFHLYNFYSLSNGTYGMLAFGLLFVMIGFLLGYGKKNRHLANKIQRGIGINFRMMVILNLFILVFLMIRMVAMAALRARGLSWWQLRLIASGNAEGENFNMFWGSGFMYNLYTYLVAPVVYMEVPLIIISFFQKRYRNTRLIILCIINFAVFSVITVSRNLMVFAIIYFIMCCICFYNDQIARKVIRRLRPYIPLIIIGLIAGIWTISSMRNTEEDIIESAYIYMVGGLPSLEHRVSAYDYSTYTWGLYTFRGFLRPIFSIFNVLGIEYPEAYQVVNQITSDLEKWIPIGNDVRMNAYATMFYSLFRDGGYLGIALGSLGFGYICVRVYRNMKIRRDMRSMVFYFLIIQQIFFSMARLYTVFPTRAFSFVWLFILIRPDRTNGENRQLRN